MNPSDNDPLHAAINAKLAAIVETSPTTPGCVWDEARHDVARRRMTNEVLLIRKRPLSLCVLTALWLLMLGDMAAVAAPLEPPARAGQEGIFTLPGKLSKHPPHSPLFDYDLKLEQERFYLFVPPNYRGDEPFGLIAFVNSGDQMDVPTDWKKVLTDHKLLYVAPQNIGNNQPIPRRAVVAVAAIRQMMKLYKVDPQRVYITGVSGGAKVATVVAFARPSLIHGALPMCGFVLPTLGEKGKELRETVKSQVGFALITGSQDFNYQGIVAYYNNTLLPEKYRARLFDVPGMGHQIATGQTLDAALNWLEGRDATPDADKRAKAAKPTKSPSPEVPSEK